jgi:hypothetical protein
MQPFRSTETSNFFSRSIAWTLGLGDIVNYNTKEDSY